MLSIDSHRKSHITLWKGTSMLDSTTNGTSSPSDLVVLLLFINYSVYILCFIYCVYHCKRPIQT